MGKTVSPNQGANQIATTPTKPRRSFWHHLGISRDGIITGAADNDPAGITTSLQIGATAGFGLLWLLPILAPLVIAVEEMSARIGVVTQKGLSRLIREEYGKLIAGIIAGIVIVCNVATISANLAAIAETLGSIVGISWAWLIAPIGLIMLWLLTHNQYKALSRYFTAAALVLLLYVATGFILGPNWKEVGDSLIDIPLPLSQVYLVLAVALVGTTIAPYLIFWQSTAEIEDRKKVADLGKESIGVASGFIFSLIVTGFVIITAALAFDEHHLITTAAEAAQSLRPIAGELAFALFAVAIVGSGFLSVPILAASTAYVGAEAVGAATGLGRHFKQARGFYIILAGAIGAGGLLTLTNLSPIMLMLYSQILSGVLAPVLVAMLLVMANNKKVMRHHTNPWLSNLLGIAALVLMIGLDVALLLTYL